MQHRSSDTPAIAAAAVTAAAMIAQQVGGKAVRDALFLSRYSVTALPAVALATALLSVAAALLAARVLTARGPRKVIPMIFAASAAVLLVLWAIGGAFPRGQSVALYLHVSVIGMILISGFWSLINEVYDPRAAKRRIGKIAAGGTLGGLAGGILAERTGSLFGIQATFPVLAGLHALCAMTSLAIPAPPRRRRKPDASGSAGKEEGTTRLGLRVFGRTPYLRTLTWLVLLSTLAAALVDYVFKLQAAQHMNGPALLRLFAGFYTAVGLITFIVQTTASRWVLERVGLARSVASLPLGVAAGSLGALMAPGPVTAGIARGLESVLRNSLYRSGYEVLFSPIPPREKRATKAIVDVGVERIGDALAAGVVQVVLTVATIMAAPLLLGLAIISCLAGLEVARRLQGGYVATLERNLVSRAGELDLADPGSDPMVTVYLSQTIYQAAWADDSAVDFLEEPDAAERARPLPGPMGPGADTGATIAIPTDGGRRTRHIGSASSAPAPEGTGAADEMFHSGAGGIDDPLLRRIRDLRSGDVTRVQRAIAEAGPVDRSLAPHVIPLLAWEAVAETAGRALREASEGIVGQLVDSLTDPAEDFAIRRRIPRLLSACSSPIAVEGLLQGLLDQRFEVRLRCGRALLHLQETIGILPLEADRIYLPVLREVAVDRRVWESQRLLDLPGDDEESLFIDHVLRERASRSLEHVFTVLSLALPRQPLQVAFRGLYAEDPSLRGMALEYLDSVLPPHVRDALWPLLEDHVHPVAARRSREDVLADLVRSNESIEIDLRSLRRRDGPS